MKRKLDRRVQRTQRMLRDALVALLHARAWDDISVSDICARADVGRSTFYLHFTDKEELLLRGFDELKAMLRAQPGARGGPPLQFAKSMMLHAHENRRLFSALVGKRSGQVVLRQFRGLVLELVSEDLEALPAGPRREATARYLAGAFVELLSWSLEQPRALDVAQLERWFAELSRPVLAVGARAGA